MISLLLFSFIAKREVDEKMDISPPVPAPSVESGSLKSGYSEQRQRNNELTKETIECGIFCTLCRKRKSCAL